MKYSSPLPKNIFLKISLTVTFAIISVVMISFYFFSYNLKSYLDTSYKEKLDTKIDSAILRIERDGINNFCNYIQIENDFLFELRDKSQKIICKTSKSKVSLNRSKNFYLNSKPLNLKVFNVTDNSGLVLKNLSKKVFYNSLPLVLALFFMLYTFLFYYSRSISKVFVKTLQIGKKLQYKDDEIKLEIKKNSILLQSISDGILALNKDYRTLFQNIRFNRLFNYNSSDNESINTYIGDKIYELFKDCLETGEDQVIYNHELNDRIIDIRVSAIISADSKVEGAIGVFRDITKVQKTRKLKAEFITNISHELKTPLTSIKGYSEMLVENSKTVSEQDLKYIKKILNNSNKLIDIYDNLLNLSNVENTKTLEKEEFEIQPYLEETFNTLKNKYSKPTSLLKTQLDLKSINVNSKLFKQALYNLMENSFKYSGENLLLNISLKNEDHNLVIKFIDNGIGIAEDKIKRVFERFYRTDESRSSEIAGTGIGLSIVKHIIEKHNGKIHVSSNSEGTSFIIILPQA